MRRLSLAALLALALVTGACAPERPDQWSERSSPDQIPAPDGGGDAVTAQDPPERSISDTVGVIVDDECFAGEHRCGRVSVPQHPESDDLVDVAFRIVDESGSGTPVVLLEGISDEFEVTASDFPDRPLIVIGSRGQWPGGPNLSCPEFSDTETAVELQPATAECLRRIVAAGVAPEATTAADQARDTATVLGTLGYDTVDVVASSWRAATVAHLADRLSVRSVVYVQPWFDVDPVMGAADSTLATLAAVWLRCDEIESCTTPGTVGDFLEAIRALDDDPLDDPDPYVDDPRPIDAGVVMGAVVAKKASPSDAAFLPRLHRAILDRDAATVSAFVTSGPSSAEVNLLAFSCARFTSAVADADALPSPLREDTIAGHEFLDHVCSEWPHPSSTPAGSPLPGLSVITQTIPRAAGVTDEFRVIEGAGPVIVEPTIGQPTSPCVMAAAVAWFDDERVDDGRCDAPLQITDRNATISLTEGVYEFSETMAVALPVPDGWSDSSYGTWWRDADPLDLTNLDVYVWEADSAAQTRDEMTRDWGIEDPVYLSIQAGERVWLVSTGTTDVGDALTIAASRIDDVNIGVILQASSVELDDLTDTVLLPALEGVELR